MNKETVNLVIKFTGSGTDEGMDLFDAAPSLLALGTIIKEANAELFDAEQEIGINIKPFSKGSFIVEMALFAKTNYQELLKVIKSTDGQDIKLILEWLSLIGGGSVGIWKLIKFLKGKPATKREQLAPAEIRYTNEDGSQIIINDKVDKLYNNPTIHNHFYQAYKPLEKPGIDGIESYLKEEKENKATFEKSDAELAKKYTESELPEQIDESKNTIYETYLNFKRGSYEGEHWQWSFRKGDKVIIAAIKDQKFLQQIKSGEIRPFQKDLLRVKMIEKYNMSGTEIKDSSHEIIEVIEYKPYKDNKLL
jgi:hypothetical protein